MGTDNQKSGNLNFQTKLASYIKSFRDIRNIGALAFVVMVLLVSWNGLQAIQRNFELQKEMQQLEKANEVKRLANENLKLSNAYYETSQYLEVTARRNLGMAAPGETVLLVPEETVQKYIKPMPEDEMEQKAAKKLPFWRENFEAWMDFFLHRGVD